MAGFFIPDPRFEMPSLLEPGRKPVGPVQIDWGHYLSEKLVGCYLLNNRAVTNLVNNKVTEMTADDGSIARNNVNFTGSNGLLIDLYTDDVFPQGTIITSGYSPNSAGLWNYFVWGGGASGDFAMAQYQPNNRFRTDLNSTFLNNDGLVTTTLDDNNLLSWRFDVDSNTQSKNTNTGSATSTATISQPTNSQIRIGGRFYDGREAEEMYFIYFWNRFLTDAEEGSIRDHPYQMLIPK
jgi:hypothetical protein